MTEQLPRPKELMTHAKIRAGDLVVSRATGTGLDATYLVGRIVETVSQWVLDPDAQIIRGRESAIQWAYDMRSNSQRVWLFDRGIHAGEGYIEAPDPAHSESGRSR